MTGAPTYSAAILLAAILLDLGLGEPSSRFHPVVWIGRAISACSHIAHRWGTTRQLAWGGLVALALPLAVGRLSWVVVDLFDAYPWWTFIVSVLLLKSSFSLRAFAVAAGAVQRALAVGDVNAARAGIRSLCSREGDSLTETELVGATVESVAENSCDSFIAPLFYFCILGVPGAMMYRCINTLDSMVGYHGRYEYVGKASARLDDVVNFVPARITTALFLMTGWLWDGDVRNGWRILRRDGLQTESPNAGQTMATMAGLLRIRLDKPGCYQLGDPHGILDAKQISRAWRVAMTSMLVFAAAALGVHLAA